MDYIGKRVLLDYDIPMNEIVMDFYDKLKSTTKVMPLLIMNQLDLDLVFYKNLILKLQEKL